MSHYPIIIIPDSLKKLKSQVPKTPKFDESQPQPPLSAPQPIEIKLIAVEFLVILGTAIGLGIIKFSLGVSFLGFGLIAIAIQAIFLKSNFPRRLQKYEQAQKDFPAKLENFYHRQAEHNLELKNLLSPENIAEFRQRQLLDILKKTTPHNGTNSKARRGFSEVKFAKHLKRYFGDNIHERLIIAIPNFPSPYSPDFAYIDRALNLYIDIEIDEPYANQKSNQKSNNNATREPIHYLGKDNRRNQFFASRGWVVVRFCEEQVVRYPRQCCKVVAEVIADILGDNLELSGFSDTQSLPQIKHWTKAEAILMIKNQARDLYLNSK